MARKVDKMRPYRVDYLDYTEVRDGKAIVHSALIRAVTAADAKAAVESSQREIVRAYRFYRPLPNPKSRFTAFEKLFSANKVQSVRDRYEGWKELMTATKAPDYAPTTGPDSPETKAVVADLQGYIDHDKHEQLMDTFSPEGQIDRTVPNDPFPFGTPFEYRLDPIKTIDLDVAAPVLSPAPDLPESNVNCFQTPVQSFKRTPHWGGCSCTVCAPPESAGTNLRKWLLAAAVLLTVLALGAQYLVMIHK